MRLNERSRMLILIWIILQVILSTIITYLTSGMLNVNFPFNYILPIVVIISGILSYIVLSERFQEPISHQVAIIGFPKSGKTTLIISLFSEAFAKNLPIRMNPKGQKTIELVNKSLEMLEKGQALGPTKDQDLFSFKTELTLKRFPFDLNYKIEFGDFPGHDTNNYIKKYGHWLHTTEFFKWVAESDALIFVVDLGHYLSKPKSRLKYVAEISSALRAAWQHYLDINQYRINKIQKHPLVILFHKADLFCVFEKHAFYELAPEEINFDNLEQEGGVDLVTIESEIIKLGFGEDVPPIEEINQRVLSLGKTNVFRDFAQLITYFKDEAPNTHILFTSCFGTINGKRLGISELLLAILPK